LGYQTVFFPTPIEFCLDALNSWKLGIILTAHPLLPLKSAIPWTRVPSAVMLKRLSPFCYSAMALLCLFLGAPCLADTYTDAVADYKAGNYVGAKDLFLRVAAEKPLYYQSHYWLANTYLKLNQPEDARIWYNICLKCKPDASTSQNCQKALAYLEQVLGSGKAPPVAGNKEETHAESESPSKHGESAEQGSDSVRVAEAHRKIILNDAERQAKAIKDAAEEQLKEIEESGNYWVRDTDNNNYRTGVPSNIREEITHEADEKARHILEDAKKRADLIALPKGAEAGSSNKAKSENLSSMSN
jgi:tetratricopeptide (TPR) repeat protein